MSYIGRKPGFGIRNRYYYTATTSQTTFSGADDNGQTLAYADSKYLDVYLNGVLLVAGTDYTATTLTSVTLASGAAASDIVEIVAYDIFSVADTVSAKNGGTFNGNITIDGDLTASSIAYPTSDGTSGQVITTDGSGTLSFTTIASDKIEEGNSSVEVVDAGTGKIEFTVDAVEIADFTASAVVFNESGADVDFRIESDTDANALFVEGSSGNVGIGTSSPAALLDVRAFATANIRIGSTGTDLGNNTEIGTLEFFNSDGDQNAVAAYVRAIRGSSFGSGGLLTFATSESGSPAGTIAERMRIDSSGAVTIGGSLSKGSGSFKIDHPLKPETHHLVHSFVEAPQADNIYRGKVDLVNGTATVNIDTVAGMTEGTFVALNREVQCFTSNESGWTAVRGSVSGNTLTIEAQDNTCTDTVSWMVVGERQDQHMYDTGWTDENGKVIVEPEKPTTEEVTGETP
jgi:hypothetical protein